MVDSNLYPDFFRAQVVLQAQTNEPRDNFVNTFYFRNDHAPGTSVGTVVTAIKERLTNFYNGSPGVNGVAPFLSNNLIKATAIIKVYDLGKPKPRLPMDTSFALVGMGGTGAIPAEVAGCLSYFAGRPLPRRRGRIFLGPLSAGALTTTGGTVRLNATFRDSMRAAAAGLRSDPVQSPVIWHLYSPTSQRMLHITGGWVDDAPDIQRRRGVAPGAKEPWGDPAVNVDLENEGPL